MVIDIRSTYPSPGLYARNVWEALFREVHGEKFTRLDSFLCDLKIFEKLFAEGKRPVTIWWQWHPTGWTEVTQFDPHAERCYKVTLENERIVIENTSCPL